MSAGGSACVGLVGSAMKEGGAGACVSDLDEKTAFAKEVHTPPQRAVNILIWATI